MTWKVLSSSVRGTSHANRNEEGQDYCRAGVRSVCDRLFLIALAADGAGSTTDGGTGAKIACETACHGIIDTIRLHGGDLTAVTRQEIENWIASSREAIGATAERDGKQIRSYACTLIGTILGETNAIYFQIGDGGIVTDNGTGYRTVFWPEQGEYANTTYFLTDDSVLGHLIIRQEDAVPAEVALFTDGLQNLVLSFPTKTVHSGFFQPLFERIRNSTDNEFRAISEGFHIFLTGDEIERRSDDDKTLILAVRSTART